MQLIIFIVRIDCHVLIIIVIFRVEIWTNELQNAEKVAVCLQKLRLASGLLKSCWLYSTCTIGISCVIQHVCLLHSLLQIIGYVVHKVVIVQQTIDLSCIANHSLCFLCCRKILHRDLKTRLLLLWTIFHLH